MLKLLHVPVLIHHLQGVYKLRYLNLWFIQMIKYNIVLCCDKILVNVAAYVIPNSYLFLRVLVYNKYLEPRVLTYLCNGKDVINYPTTGPNKHELI
jgi:hypothetical protein